MTGQAVFTQWEQAHHAAQPYYDRLWAKMSPGLRAQAAKRLSRAQANDIEVNSVRVAGSFKQFQSQLRRENGRLFAETVKMKAYHLEQVKALPGGSEVKLLTADVQKPKRTVLDDYLFWKEREALAAEGCLDRICARQARRDGWRENGLSSPRAMDVLNPFKWIAAFIDDSKGGK